ncbi:hypothetical protein pb186bvf_014655 [Paramecium bursaria]
MMLKVQFNYWKSFAKRNQIQDWSMMEVLIAPFVEGFTQTQTFSLEQHFKIVPIKLINNQITCCLDCLDMDQFWNDDWKQTIIFEEENIDQFQQFEQQPQLQVNLQKCDECKKELINIDVVSLGNCDHLYCKDCFSTLICSYKIMDIYQQNQLVCPLCKNPIDDRIIQIVDYKKAVIKINNASVLQMAMLLRTQKVL